MQSTLLSQELQDEWKQLGARPGLAQPVGAPTEEAQQDEPSEPQDSEVAGAKLQDTPGETIQRQLFPQSDDRLETLQESALPCHNPPHETETSSPTTPAMSDSLDLSGIGDVELECFFHDAFSVSHSFAR